MSATNWQCVHCTLLNNPSAFRCIVCDKRRPRNCGTHCDTKKTQNEDNDIQDHEESFSLGHNDNNNNETGTVSQSANERNEGNKQEIAEEPEYESSSFTDSGSDSHGDSDSDETDIESQSQSENAGDVSEKQKKLIIADDSDSSGSESDEAGNYKSAPKMEEKENKIMPAQKSKKRRKRNEYSKIVIRRKNEHLQIWLKISHLLPGLDIHSLQSQRDSIVNIFGTDKEILLFLVEHCNEKQITRLDGIVRQKEIYKIKYIYNQSASGSFVEKEKTNSNKLTLGKLFRHQSVLHHICGYLKRENIKYFKPCSAHIALVGLREMQKYSIDVCNINDILVNEQSDDIYKDIVTNNDKYIGSHRFVSSRYYPNTRYYSLYSEWSKQYNIPIQNMLVYKTGYPPQLFSFNEQKYNFIVAKQEFIIFDKRKMVKITERGSKLLSETYIVNQQSKIIILKYFDIKRQKPYNVQCLLFDRLALSRCTMQRVTSYIENEFLWLDAKWCNFLKDIKQPLISIYNRWNRIFVDAEDDKKINDAISQTINFITFQVVDINGIVNETEAFKHYSTFNNVYTEKRREDSPTPKSRILARTSYNYKLNNFVTITRCNLHTQRWIKMRHLINKLDSRQLNIYKNYIFKKFFSNHTKRIIRFYVQYASKEKLYKIYDIIKDIEPQNANVTKTSKKKKKKKKKQFVSFDNLLPFTTIHHICGYLRRSDANIFKLVSYSISIVCLEAMQKIFVGICNTNEIVKEIDRNSSGWRDLMKYHRHHCKKQYFALFSEWEHHFNIAEKYQLIYDFHDNAAWKIDMKKDIETVIHSRQWFILFDLRNIILLQNQTIKSIDAGSVIKDDNKIIVLKYFDIRQQKIYISQIIMVDANVTARRILEYIEHQFKQTNNWHHSLKSILNGMLYDGNHEKLAMYVNRTLVNDIDCKMGAVHLKQAVAFVTFQLNAQHSYFNDDKMNEMKKEYETKHLLTWHNNIRGFETDNDNIIELTINYINGAQVLRTNMENYLRSKATIHINKDAILHNAGMEMKIFVKKHVKYESIKVKIAHYLFGIVPATNIEIYDANSFSNESNDKTIIYSESILFDFVGYDTFSDRSEKLIARIFTPKQCPYPIYHTKDIQTAITFKYDSKNDNKKLNIKQDIVNKIFNESMINPVCGKQFNKIIKLHKSGHIIYVVRVADNWGRWSVCYGINQEVVIRSYISYRFIDIFLLNNHNYLFLLKKKENKCLLLIKFATKKAKITSKLKPSDLKDSMFVGLPLIIPIARKHSLADIINKYILQFKQYIDCTYKIDKTNLKIGVIKKNVRDQYFPYGEFTNNYNNENYMIFSFKNIDRNDMKLQQFTGKIIQSLSL